MTENACKNLKFEYKRKNDVHAVKGNLLYVAWESSGSIGLVCRFIYLGLGIWVLKINRKCIIRILDLVCDRMVVVLIRMIDRCDKSASEMYFIGQIRNIEHCLLQIEMMILYHVRLI